MFYFILQLRMCLDGFKILRIVVRRRRNRKILEMVMNYKSTGSLAVNWKLKVMEIQNIFQEKLFYSKKFS